MKKTRMILVGKRIRQAREMADFTQEKLADMIGVSRTAVVRWESGETDPTIDHLIKMTVILDVSADFLLGTGGNNQMVDVLKNLASTLNQIVSEMEQENSKGKERERSNGKKN